MDRAPRMTRDIMTPDPFVLPATVSIRDAAGLLLREHHSGAPVIDDEGRLVGVLSELDLLQALSVIQLGELPWGTVADHMTQAPTCVDPTTSVFDLAALFRAVPYRRLPVVDDGRLVGLVARHDAVRAMACLARECRVAQGTGVAFVP